MEERYVLAVYEGDPDHLQDIADDLWSALAQESMALLMVPESEQDLPF
jgi:hypothetical protein